ncbi:MAG: BlaI/MecI/CopY family transcriptional regulator [Oscillospiraceae bacterium]|nr:BlaI/MecI/CopY family transcriptional regulator [Oscillospiraceae bacterium]
MSKDYLDLTETEWKLLECLWEKSPRTGRETVEYMAEHIGWTRSTTLTMLRRMTEKGLIGCDESGAVLTYSPFVKREDAVQRETRSFIDRVYKGSVSLLINALTEKQNLSQRDIDELHAILRRAEEGKND